MKRFALPASLAVLSLIVSTQPAAASVTIGDLAPGSPPLASCHNGPDDLAQPVVRSGNSYVVPPGGAAITSWSTNAAARAGQMLTMKVFRKIADPATYMVVGHDGPRSLTPGVINRFAVNIPVKPGDVLGLNDQNAGSIPNACVFSAPGESDVGRFFSDLADGASAAFMDPFDTDDLLNVAAVVAPSNAFSLGAISRNKKKGTAMVNVSVPNPGQLALSGNGVKSQEASPGAPGDADLLIKAKGKKKKKLDEKGKVKLNVGITYTPTGGDPSTQSIKVKLKKKL